MIKIENLTKIYKSKKKNNCKALDNVTLTLPNSGLVFVLGKSGSGKSTLLNLIGGLDNITKGTIIVDGNNISNFKEKEYCDYRNNHIGFIFQDYHLIDELTVYDNIVLSLNLRRIEDKEDVLNALKKVDLQGYENRYPTELSGGERQRVAIARAIVKNPRIILADEPTGNLDTNTATAIIQILKELSKECLILIVSHNVNDANKYADRIIELSKGKIINDITKNIDFSEKIKIKDNQIVYPIGSILDEQDIDLINNNKNCELVINKEKYVKTTNVEDVNEKIAIEKRRLKVKKELKLSLKFLKNKIFNISLSSFMVSAIMIILALAQTIMNFDSGQIISNEMDKLNYTSICLEKKLTDEVKQSGIPFTDCVTEVEDGDYEAFANVVGSDNLYEVYNLSTGVSLCDNYSGNKITVFKHGIYVDESLGTIVVDENFFVEKLGKLEYVELNENIELSGVYITDYLADSILLYNSALKGKTYNDILGDYYFSSYTTQRGYINGIIKTNYKEKYAEFIEECKTKNFSDLDVNNDETVISFINDIYDVLGYSYTFNKNFKEDFIANSHYGVAYHHKMVIDGVESISLSNKYVSYSSTLKDNEVIMNYQKYNEVYGTNYTVENLDSFIPHNASITQYRYYDVENKKSLGTQEVKIVKLTSSSKGYMIVSENVFNKFNANSIFVKGYYYNSNKNIDKIINICEKNNFEQKSIIVDGIHTMTKAVDVFIPIFELIAIVLCVGIVLILVSFSSKMIKDKMHEIGILKALGTQNSSITSIFGLQIVLIALLTIIMSTLGYLFFIDLANDVLIESLKQLAPSHVVLDLDFLIFKIDIALTNMLLVLALALVSLLVPMLKIKSIKPVKIIKAKE